jgi:hypothetical protein
MAEYAAACAAAYLIHRNEHKIYEEVYWYIGIKEKSKNTQNKCEYGSSGKLELQNNSKDYVSNGKNKSVIQKYFVGNVPNQWTV